MGLMGGPGVLGGFGWFVVMRHFFAVVLARRVVRTRGAGVEGLARVADHGSMDFSSNRTPLREPAICRRCALVDQLRQLERRICIFRQPWRSRRAARWSSGLGKALQGRTPPARADRPRRVSGPTAAAFLGA